MPAKQDVVSPGQRDFIKWLEVAANGAVDSEETLERRHFAEALYIRRSAWTNWQAETRLMSMGSAKLFCLHYGLNWKKVVKQAIKCTGEQRWIDELQAEDARIKAKEAKNALS